MTAARFRKPGAVRGTHVAPFGNVGVQGGTESSNLLCSCGESTNSRSLSSARGPSGPRLADELEASAKNQRLKSEFLDCSRARGTG